MKQDEEQEYLANESAKAIADNEAKIEMEHQREQDELRGKIESVLCGYPRLTKEILALIPNKDVVTSEMLVAIVKGAKNEERERILQELSPIMKIAISSLKYCEKKYEHDDMARLNVERRWQALKEEKVNG